MYYINPLIPNIRLPVSLIITKTKEYISAFKLKNIMTMAESDERKYQLPAIIVLCHCAIHFS